MTYLQPCVITYCSHNCILAVQGDECGILADFNGPNLAAKYSFSNFPFKLRSASPSYIFSSSWNFRCRITMKILHFSSATFNVCRVWLHNLLYGFKNLRLYIILVFWEVISSSFIFSTSRMFYILSLKLM